MASALEIGSSGDTITIPSGATFTQSGTMNASAITAGTLAAARGGTGDALGGGKVLQYVRTNYDTNNNVATTSYSTTGLTASITPTATDTHIVGFVSLQCRFHNVTNAYEAGYSIAVKRDSTIIFEDDASTSLNFAIYYAFTDDGTTNISQKSSWNFADTSHSTTSAITYTVFAKVQNTNEQGKFQDATYPSQLLLMEFAS